MSGKRILLLYILAWGGLLGWSLTSSRAWGLEDRLVPVFSSSLPAGRVTLASGGGLLFLLSEKAGTVSRIDPGTWTLSVRIAGLKNPRDLAVGRSGGRLLVDLESSRSLLLLPSTAAGPPLQRTVGLNPGQILGGSDNHYYLVARAVHLLYALDPDSYLPRNWIAVGDVFRRVAPDGGGHLWLPLFRSDGVMEVGTSPFAVLRTIDLDGCTGPVSVLPLPAGGFMAGCHDAIVRSNAQGAVRRVGLREGLRHGVRELLMFPGGRKALAIFRRSRMMVLFDLGSMNEISRYRLPYRPARLYIFPNWPILFVVMNDPDHEMTRLSGYRLSDFLGQSDTLPVTYNSGKKK